MSSHFYLLDRSLTHVIVLGYLLDGFADLRIHFWLDCTDFYSVQQPWDDWGAWYDHVPPTILNSCEYGFRVPLIVVSPYAKRAYVSHVTHDYGSLLKFIETQFNLGSLGYADSLADDFSDCFDFTQTPGKFQFVQSKFDALHFLTDKTPALDPDDD